MDTLLNLDAENPLEPLVRAVVASAAANEGFPAFGAVGSKLWPELGTAWKGQARFSRLGTRRVTMDLLIPLSEMCFCRGIDVLVVVRGRRIRLESGVLDSFLDNPDLYIVHARRELVRSVGDAFVRSVPTVVFLSALRKGPRPGKVQGPAQHANHPAAE